MTRSIAASTGVDLAALTAWMDAQNLGNGPIEATQMLAGGTQNILLRFTREAREAREARDYILRRPPPAVRPAPQFQ